MKKHTRRRQLFVDRPMQNRIIFSVAWPPAIALAITTALLLKNFRSLAAEAEIARLELPSLVPTVITVIGFVGLAACFVLMTALRTSHRVVGSMVAFRRAFDGIKTGALSTRVRLRRGDFVTGIADEVNEFLVWLEERDAPPAGAQYDEPAPEQQLEEPPDVATASIPSTSR